MYCTGIWFAGQDQVFRCGLRGALLMFVDHSRKCSRPSQGFTVFHVLHRHVTLLPPPCGIRQGVKFYV